MAETGRTQDERGQPKAITVAFFSLLKSEGSHFRFREKMATLRIVDESSADPGITGCIPVPLDEDHITICKPHDRQAQVYQCVKQLVNRLCQATTNPPDSRGTDNRLNTAEIPALPPTSVPVEAEQAVFEKNLRRAIVTELDKPSLAPLRAALLDRLKLSDGDAFSTVVDAWWELRSSLDRIRDWREVAEACLENPTEASNGALFIKSVRKVLALLALACVSRNWAERHRGAANPLYDVPLRYLASVELYAGVLKDDTSGYAKLPVDFLQRQTSNKGDDMNVVGANCINLLDYVPESGWRQESVLDDASFALWKGVTKENKGLAFDVTDYSFLRTLLRENRKYIAIHKQRARNNPLLLPEIHAEFQQRFAGVTIFHFGVVVEGLDQPLIVEEGELMGLITVFLKILGPYEHP